MRKIGGKRGDLSPIWSFRIQNAEDVTGTGK